MRVGVTSRSAPRSVSKRNSVVLSPWSGEMMARATRGCTWGVTANPPPVRCRPSVRPTGTLSTVAPLPKRVPTPAVQLNASGGATGPSPPLASAPKPQRLTPERIWTYSPRMPRFRPPLWRQVAAIPQSVSFGRMKYNSQIVVRAGRLKAQVAETAKRRPAGSKRRASQRLRDRDGTAPTRRTRQRRSPDPPISPPGRAR